MRKIFTLNDDVMVSDVVAEVEERQNQTDYPYRITVTAKLGFKTPDLLMEFLAKNTKQTIDLNPEQLEILMRAEQAVHGTTENSQQLRRLAEQIPKTVHNLTAHDLDIPDDNPIAP